MKRKPKRALIIAAAVAAAAALTASVGAAFRFDIFSAFGYGRSYVNEHYVQVSDWLRYAERESMKDINWVGFYLVQNDTLYLGPFQGDVACTIIPKGKGVCGTSFEKKETIIVPNVNEFKGHIACSSLSKSEIVVPIIKNGEVKALIDVDAPIFDRFSNEDKLLLEEVASLLAPLF